MKRIPMALKLTDASDKKLKDLSTAYGVSRTQVLDILIKVQYQEWVRTGQKGVVHQ